MIKTSPYEFLCQHKWTVRYIAVVVTLELLLLVLYILKGYV